MKLIIFGIRRIPTITDLHNVDNMDSPSNQIQFILVFLIWEIGYQHNINLTFSVKFNRYLTDKNSFKYIFFKYFKQVEFFTLFEIKIVCEKLGTIIRIYLGQIQQNLKQTKTSHKEKLEGNFDVLLQFKLNHSTNRNIWLKKVAFSCSNLSILWVVFFF